VKRKGEEESLSTLFCHILCQRLKSGLSRQLWTILDLEESGFHKKEVSRAFMQALLRRVIDEQFIPKAPTFSSIPKELKSRELNDFNSKFPGFFPNKKAMTTYVSKHMRNQKYHAKLTLEKKIKHLKKARKSSKKRRMVSFYLGCGIRMA
jgi:hypothetical protein